MTAPSIPALVGSKKISRRNLKTALSRVANKASGCQVRMAGKIVARALVRAGVGIVEFKRDPYAPFNDVDYSNFDEVAGKNFWTRQNPYGGRSPVGHVLKHGERLKNIAGDAMDAIRSGSPFSERFVGDPRPKATAGNFQITHEGPHSARITTQPHTRQRRKKYEWEKVGTQRQIATGVAALGTLGIAKLGAAAHAHSPDESILKGMGNMAAHGVHKAKGAIIRAAGGTYDKEFEPLFVSKRNANQKIAAMKANAPEHASKVATFPAQHMKKDAGINYAEEEIAPVSKTIHRTARKSRAGAAIRAAIKRRA
jgi:hypothetical protein